MRLSLPGGGGTGSSRLGAVLAAVVEKRAGMLTCSYGDVDRLEKDCRDDDRGTVTQSGSSVGVKGL